MKGIKNTLADTMSRLIKITPDVELEEEPEGYEFVYYAFEDLEPIQTSEIEDHTMAIHQNQSDEFIPDDVKVEWEITPKQINQAQKRDKFCKEQYNKLLKGSLPSTHPYYIQHGVLMRYITDNKCNMVNLVHTKYTKFMFDFICITHV